MHDPVYILGTRDYQHWQPARYIHWKASARYGSLKEKIFDPSEQEKVLIAIDARGFSENRASVEFEKAIEGAASLSVRLEREGYAAGLITNAVLTGGGRAVIQPGRNSAQLGMMLETMARMRMDWNLNLRDFLRRGLSFPWGMICVIFSFSADDILTEGAFFTGRGIPYSGVAVVPPEVGPCRPDTGRAGFPVIALDDLLSVIDRTEAR